MVSQPHWFQNITTYKKRVRVQRSLNVPTASSTTQSIFKNIMIMVTRNVTRNVTLKRKDSMKQGPDFDKWRVAKLKETDMHEAPCDIPIGAEIINVKWACQLEGNGTR
jgi:hypothetical protein